MEKQGCAGAHEGTLAGANRQIVAEIRIQPSRQPPMRHDHVVRCDTYVWYDESMLTVPEAAKIAGKNPETIRRWIRSGKLPAQKFGTQHMVDEIALDELVNGIRAVNVPDWLAGPSPVTGWTADDIVRMVRQDREEH